MAVQIVWYGSQEESFDLVNAVARNCSCEFGMMGVRLTTCEPHKMLVEDQRALNGLLFARRIAERLRGEEWSSGFPLPDDGRDRNSLHSFVSSLVQ